MNPIPKLVSPEELAAIRDRLDAEGKRLVLTNGCFDLLHVGHVRCLAAARELGDALAVALNGDDSVRALKGPTRPIHAEADRAEVLAALAPVDYIAIFHEPRATRLFEIVRPHLYAKGGDYTPESLDGDEAAALRRIGSEIRILPLVPGRSTTSTIARMTVGTDPR